MVSVLGINLELATESPPPILYHYTSQDGLFGILESKSIWASKIQYLNDETELNLGVQTATRIIKELLQDTPEPIKQKFLNFLSNDVQRIERTNVFVSCFSAVGDLLSQWRGYCPRGIGYSIGFDSGKLEALARNRNFLLRSCVYNPTAQKKIIVDSINQGATTFGQACTWR